jgi:SSS family solute:Na+ symporter
MLGLMIWSLFLLLTGLLGLANSTAWILIVAIVALAGLYTSLGGLKSVVMTDALQGVILFAAVLVVFQAVWQATGGWSQMLARLENISLDDGRSAASLARMSEYHGDQGQTSAWVVALGWLIIGVGYWSVNHTQTMRLSGARSLWDMKMAAIFGVAASMPIMIGCASIGLFARALFPDFETPDNLYPYLADRYLGAGLKGLVVAGIVAAAVSTFDSMSSSLSALFTRDIYARFVNSYREDEHYVRISQIATAVILASGFAYIPFIRTKETMLQAFLTLIPVFVTPLCTLYLVGVFTRAHRRSGVIGMIAGASYGILALLDREILDMTWLPEWFTGRWVALLWSFAVTSLAALATTLCIGKYDPHVPTTRPAGWLKDSSDSLRALPPHPFRATPAVWLRPETLASLLIIITLCTLWILFW